MEKLQSEISLQTAGFMSPVDLGIAAAAGACNLVHLGLLHWMLKQSSRVFPGPTRLPITTVASIMQRKLCLEHCTGGRIYCNEATLRRRRRRGLRQKNQALKTFHLHILQKQPVAAAAAVTPEPQARNQLGFLQIQP
jgi:hypothetical protein